MIRWVLVPTLALGVATVPLGAQQVELGGEIRPRFEVRDPVPDLAAGGEDTRELTTMRARLDVAARVAEGVTAFVQLQDVRAWGGEAGTTDPAADGLDLHQGWVELGDPGAGRYALRVGRQELSYGGQRLIGALNWAQQARAFDGLRLRTRPSQGVVVDAFAAQVGEYDAGQGDEVFLGLYGSVTEEELPGALDLYALYHGWERREPATDIVWTGDAARRYTLGGRWTGSASGVDWRVEAAYQLGGADRAGAVGDGIDPSTNTAADPAIRAYLLAGRVGTQLTDALGVSLWYDHLSGDDNLYDDEIRVFDTLFATNHKFYGFMDLFLSIPAHTGGRGLRDLALKSSYAVAPGQTLGVDLHTFRLAAADGLGSGHIGEELDVTYRWSYRPGVTVTGGTSYFLAGDAAPVPAAPAADDGQLWGYVMLDVAF